MRLLNRIFSAKVLPSWVILLIDLIIVTVAVLLAFLIRYNLDFFTPGNEIFIIRTILLVLAVDTLFFRIFRTYSNVIRFSSFVDLMNVFAAQGLSFLTAGIICLAAQRIAHFYLGSIIIIIITYIISFVLLMSFRLFIKVLYDTLHADHKNGTDVFIYGSKTDVINIAKSLRMKQNKIFNLCGFIADDPAMKGKVMMGVNVYQNDEQLLERITDKHASGVIISPAKMEQIHQTDFAEKMLRAGIQLYTAPDITDDWRDIHHQSIRHIQIEDLLMREPIQVDMRAISAQIEGKTVLITGAAGSIGSEITRQVASFNPYRLILVDQAETPLHDIHLELTELWRDIDASIIVADISHPERMESIFSTYRPQYVFHAAAYKHVPMMENNVSEAIQNNVLGTKIIADLSLKYGAEKFVMISTDKAVNPSNVMGCSKRICEIYVQSLAKKLQKEGRTDATQFITTRFGNVLGSNGSVIPLFRKQIEAGGPVTVTHPDIIRYFMTIPEACRLVLEAGSMGSGGEIYIFDMGRPVKIVDLAKKMITLSGRHDIKIEFTGLRRGEKLYEELLNTKENTTATRHDKILIAKVREYDFDEVSRSIQDIIDASYGFDAMGIVAKMKAIVPEFKSLNSSFSKLDKR